MGQKASKGDCCIVVHYSEIGTKGGNRVFFEKKLMENIRNALRENANRVYRRYGRIVCILNCNQGSSNVKQIDKIKQASEIKQILEKLPGISYFSFSVKAELDLEKIKKKSLEFLEKEKFVSFKIETKRSNKGFPLTSFELNREVGRCLEEKTKKRVDFKNPEFVLHIEIGEKEAFIYGGKCGGIGGLPVGTAGKVISSLSGGIDSPVASFLLMKRGCKVIFVHIHNQTQARGVLTKIEELVEQLTKMQLNSKLYVVPFEKIQKEIIMNVPSKLRMIVYRRFMMRIINQLAWKEKALGVVTGDSVGQVASQTLENLNCIYDASRLPVLNPLIGTNKEEIVELAKKIGTYETSIQPYPDCCSFLIAKHPETKGKLEEIKRAEEFIRNPEELIKESIKNAEVKKFKF